MTSSDTPCLLAVERLGGGVAKLTLTDPTRRNAISMPMRDAIVATFEELESDPEVGAVVITGEGSSFCAGAVLDDLATADSDSLRLIYDAFLRVASSPLPSVAAVNGPAVGAGLNLALSCDVRVCGMSARFISGFTRIGLHPGGGNMWLLRRAVGHQLAVAMTVLGEQLGGEEAAARGLALHCVADEDLLTRAVDLAAHAGRAPRLLVARIADTFHQLEGAGSLLEAVELELEAQAWSARQGFFQDRLATTRAANSTRGGAP
ncbi:MAG TPA: enoyl-CoA hydratase-related protein [Solirubrobacteraceae bacterium]|nr:enoyl-CoA hydratase-related protein [Solirubrobacteraceae bacterium]